jgi:WD40 repeat protein
VRTGEADHQVLGLAFAPNGKWLACAGTGGVQIRAVSSGAEMGTANIAETGGLARSVAFSADSQNIAVSTDSFHTVVWNIPARTRLATYTGHDNAVTGVAFGGPDGKLVASCAEPDAQVRLWSATTGETVAGLDFSARLVAFSPDGTLLAAAGESGASVWSLT